MNCVFEFVGASGFQRKRYSPQRRGGRRGRRIFCQQIFTQRSQRLCSESLRILKLHFVTRVVFVALTSIVFACAAAHAQTKMTVAYSSIGPMAAGVWMAKESGAFEKYGIQADIILITSGPVAVQALIGGDLHVVSAASNAVINAVLNGAPIIAVGGTANRPYHRLFVQPEINRMEDLRGKALGVTRFGSITDNLSRILLRKHGLEGAVNVRQMGGTIEVAAAFQNRLIAGAVTSELRVTPPSQPKILVRLVDMGIPYSMNMIAVQKEYYRRNPEAVENMVRAYADGLAFMNRNKERALKIITKYSRLNDARMIEEFYNDAVDLFRSYSPR